MGLFKKFSELMDVSVHTKAINTDTNVPFKGVIVKHKGQVKHENMYPQFDSFFDVKLPKHLHQAEHKDQVKYCNDYLRNKITK